MRAAGSNDESRRERALDAPDLEHARTRQRAAVLLSVVGIGASLLSLMLDVHAVAMGNAVVVAILTVNLGLVLRRGHATAAALIGLATATAFVLLVAATAGIRAYFWMHVLPPIAYFMLGTRVGAGVVIAMALLLAVRLFVTPPPLDATLVSIDVLLSFATIGVVSYIAERARLRYQAALERASLTDVLTGLDNRRAAELTLDREAALARRGVATASVVLVDVDSFKRINDTHGHEVGDRVLRELADILRATSRTADHLGRWGGEELICVLPATDLEGARLFADRVCRRVREHSFHTVGRVTISAGVAEFVELSSSSRDPTLDWLARADAALYRAKRNGRDRVELATRSAFSTAPAS
jgi:diguanylate cyclase (GGDEF)-like protein